MERSEARRRKAWAAEGYKHSGLGGVCKVSKGSLIHMIGDMNSIKLYVLRESTLHGSVTAATVSNDEPSETNLWHMHLGHMSELGMAELIKRDLLDGCTVGKMKFCEHCVFGKHKRVKFNASVHITKGTLDYVHADLWGRLVSPLMVVFVTCLPLLMITLEKCSLIF